MLMKIPRKLGSKLFVVTFYLCMASGGLKGESLVLKDGRKFEQVEFVTEEEDRIKLKHDGGIVWVSKTQVPVEYLQANDASIPAEVGHVMQETQRQEALLAKLRQALPSFKDKDGKVHDSAHIAAIESTGIKMVIDSAVIRLPFHKLPRALTDLLGMNAGDVERAKAEMASQAESAKEKADLRLTATSFLARQKCYAELEIVQYEKDGYICYGTVLERITKPVEMTLGYDRLNQRELRENRDQITIEEGRFLGRLKVYGLPTHLVGKKTWRGDLWLGGNRYVETAQGETVKTRDAFTAYQSGVEHLVKHGLGELVEDLSESKRPAESQPIDAFGNPMTQPGASGSMADPFGPRVNGRPPGSTVGGDRGFTPGIFDPR